MGRAKGIGLIVVFALIWAKLSLGQTLVEIELRRPYQESGPPPWESLLKEAFYQAVMDLASRLGAKKEAQAQLAEMAPNFIRGYRIVEKRDLPPERVLKIQAWVLKDDLFRFLKKGALLNEPHKYLLIIEGLKEYKDYLEVLNFLKNSKDVISFSLKEASKEAFRWEVFMREGLDPLEAFKDLPLSFNRVEENLLRARWER
jgi:hypothetical protein